MVNTPHPSNENTNKGAYSKSLEPVVLFIHNLNEVNSIMSRLRQCKLSVAVDNIVLGLQSD